MIFAIGLDTDKTYLNFLKRANEAGADVQAINLRAVAREPWQFAVPARSNRSHIYLSEGAIELDPEAAYFVRAIDLSSVLPERAAVEWRSMLLALTAFLETVSGTVINRPGNHAHNATKPFHEAWLVRNGLDVPASLTSSDPAALRDFVARRGPCIVKALSGARGITRLVETHELDDFDPASGPIHIQQLVTGDDVRAHVVADRVFSERIRSRAIDYRSTDEHTVHESTEIPSALASIIVEATRRLGLVFAGWDFKVDDKGRYWCLEANPMPGYDVYDRRAEGVISTALLTCLGHDAD